MLIEELKQLEDIIGNLQKAVDADDIEAIYDYSDQAHSLYAVEVPQIDNAFDQMKQQSGLVHRSAKTIIQLLLRYLNQNKKHHNNTVIARGVDSLTENEYESQVYRVMKVVLAIPDAPPKVVAEKCGIELSELYKTLAFISDEHLLEGLSFATGGRGNVPRVVFYNSVQRTIAGINFMKQFERDGVPHLKEAEKPTVFVSYNHKSSLSFAESLERRLASCARVIRDNSSLASWGSFTEFMKTIRKQDFAVLVITKDYLRSTACMYEVSELMKDDDWKNKVMFAVTDESMYSSSPSEFIQFWQDAEKTKNEEAVGVDPVNMGPISAELQRIRAIQNCFGEFFTAVCDSNNPKPWNVIEAIIDRIKQTTYVDFASDFDNTPYAEERQRQIDKALGRI